MVSGVRVIAKAVVVLVLLVSCTSKQEQMRKEWRGEVSADYCSVVFHELAPTIPAGVMPVVERVNPYPALPDYSLYPDVSLLNQNAKRIHAIAKCMHKRCVGLKDREFKKQDTAVNSGSAQCGKEKDNFVMKSFLEIFDRCSVSPGSRLKVIAAVRKLHEQKAGIALEVCPSIVEGTPELAQVLDLDLRECKLDAEDCETGLRCALNGNGLRCIEAPEIDLGLLPIKTDTDGGGMLADDAKTTRLRFAQKGVGQSCTTSRECTEVASCLSLFSEPASCRAHCKISEDCMKNQVCWPDSAGLGWCSDVCPEGKLRVSDEGNLCLPTKSGNLEIKVSGSKFMESLGDWTSKSTGGARRAPELWTQENYAQVVAELGVNEKCGNGVLDFPETCDYGKDNGVISFGCWCTNRCELAECGNSILEAGETCECLPGYTARAEDGHRMKCPDRWAVSDGSAKAVGWFCTPQCEIHHQVQEIMNYRRNNSHFLPEFICANPLDSEGRPRPECVPTNMEQ